MFQLDMTYQEKHKAEGPIVQRKIFTTDQLLC